MAEEKYSVIIEDLYAKYEKSPDWVLKGINLKVKYGEFLVVVGPNDSGKSTLAQCLNGIIPHALRSTIKGNIIVDGLNTKQHSISELSTRIGLTFQDPETQFLLSRVEDEIAFGPFNLGYDTKEIMRRVNWALDVTRLQNERYKDPIELSGGQKQRTAIAATISMTPKIIVLDEPTSMLDPLGKAELVQLLIDLRKKTNMTIILIEHHIDEIAELADRFVLLKDGEIQREGPPREFFEATDFLWKSFVRVPDVIRVSAYFKKKGYVDKISLGFEEAVQDLSQAIEKHNLKPDLDKYEPIDVKVKKGEKIVEIRDLHFTYPDGTVALRGIDLDVHSGEFIAFIGQNGSGKTTLSKHFNGLLKPTKGHVIVFGQDTRKTPIPKLAMNVGYVFQNPDHQIFHDTVEGEIRFGLENLLRLKLITEEEIPKRIEESMRVAGIPEEYLKEHPLLLSKGFRQRVALASIIAMRPKLIIVDEPTTGQDMKQSIEVMEFLKKLNELGHTIIVVTHEMWVVAKWTQRTVALSQGKVLIDGPTRKVLSETELLESTFVHPPQITRLSQRLSKYGTPKDVLMTEEFLPMF